MSVQCDRHGAKSDGGSRPVRGLALPCGLLTYKHWIWRPPVLVLWMKVPPCEWGADPPKGVLV